MKHVYWTSLGALFAVVCAAVVARGELASWGAVGELGTGAQIDLALAWRASVGEWVGLDFSAPRGPLWQLVARLSAIGPIGDPAALLMGRQLVFPLASLVVVAHIAWDRGRGDEGGTGPRWEIRALLLAALGVLALHHGDETLPALLGLAAAVELTEPRPRRPVAAGVFAGLAAWLAPSSFGWLAAIFVIAGALAMAGPAPRAARRATGIATVVFLSFVMGLLAVVGMAALRPEIGAPGQPAAPGIALLACTVAVALIMVRVDRGGARAHAALIVGVLPAGLLFAMRGDAQSTYLGSVVLAGAMIVAAVRVGRRSLLAGGLGALLSVLVVLGWWSADLRRADVGGNVFALAWGVIERDETEPLQGDLARAVGRLRELRGCVVIPDHLASAVLVTTSPGPFDPGCSDARTRAEAIGRSDCPWALASIRGLDRPRRAGRAFGHDALTLAELYEARERLGPALFLLRRRTEPTPAARTPLALGQTPTLGARRLDVRLPRPVDAAHLLAVTLQDVSHEGSHLRVTGLSRGRPAGAAERVRVSSSGETLVPIDQERAQWRWWAGRRTRRQRSVDGLRISLEGGSARLGALVELAPGSPAVPPARAPCVRQTELAEPPLARHTPATFTDGVIALDPNPPGAPVAEAIYPLTPCAGACLLGEVGLDPEAARGRDGFRFEVEVIEGAERTRAVDYTIVHEWRRPFEVPLGEWAGQEVLLRLATDPRRSEEEDRARVYRPRVRPCSSVLSLVTALHSANAHEVVRGGRESWATPSSFPCSHTGTLPRRFVLRSASRLARVSRSSSAGATRSLPSRSGSA